MKTAGHDARTRPSEDISGRQEIEEALIKQAAGLGPGQKTVDQAGKSTRAVEHSRSDAVQAMQTGV
ncbi:hypothetical protein [Comamonas aquatilis]|uniref:hypothetical protein n=1 Tax=Comamonas aquatilis TaxID=1778406 RepID=UPI0039EEC3B4